MSFCIMVTSSASTFTVSASFDGESVFLKASSACSMSALKPRLPSAMLRMSSGGGRLRAVAPSAPRCSPSAYLPLSVVAGGPAAVASRRPLGGTTHGTSLDMIDCALVALPFSPAWWALSRTPTKRLSSCAPRSGLSPDPFPMGSGDGVSNDSSLITDTRLCMLSPMPVHGDAHRFCAFARGGNPCTWA